MTYTNRDVIDSLHYEQEFRDEVDTNIGLLLDSIQLDHPSDRGLLTKIFLLVKDTNARYEFRALIDLLAYRYAKSILKIESQSDSCS